MALRVICSLLHNSTVFWFRGRQPSLSRSLCFWCFLAPHLVHKRPEADLGPTSPLGREVPNSTARLRKVLNCFRALFQCYLTPMHPLAHHDQAPGNTSKVSCRTRPMRRAPSETKQGDWWSRPMIFIVCTDSLLPRCWAVCLQPSLQVVMT